MPTEGHEVASAGSRQLSETAEEAEAAPMSTRWKGDRANPLRMPVNSVVPDSGVLRPRRVRREAGSPGTHPKGSRRQRLRLLRDLPRPPPPNRVGSPIPGNRMIRHRPGGVTSDFDALKFEALERAARLWRMPCRLLRRSTTGTRDGSSYAIRGATGGPGSSARRGRGRFSGLLQGSSWPASRSRWQCGGRSGGR